jgi:hypothetical protein
MHHVFVVNAYVNSTRLVDMARRVTFRGIELGRASSDWLLELNWVGNIELGTLEWQ